MADVLADDMPKTRDPARLAIAIMLRRTIADAGMPSDDRSRDGTIFILTLPAPEWTEVAEQEWSDWARSGHQPIDMRQQTHSELSPWYCWASDKAPGQREMDLAAAAVVEAIAEGRHCLGLAYHGSWLPEDLLLAADHTLRVRPLMAQDLSIVTGILCGKEPSDALTNEQARLLTPRLLRLARPRNGGPDDYIERLRHLLGRTATAAPKAPLSFSPRLSPSLDRLHGMDEAVGWGSVLAADLAAYRGGKLAWADVDHACLLSGPPGCGKTLFARALAKTSGVPLITASHAAWQAHGHQGDLLRAMRETFANARTKAPCILLIDEIDSFPDRRQVAGSNSNYTVQVVNALLAEIDGVTGRAGVVLLAACNHPDLLDPALVRSGRLDRHIIIKLPDRRSLERIFREHLGSELAGEGLSLAALAAMGSSGADCERFVRGARRRARSAARTIQTSDLLAEIEGETSASTHDLWTAAVHESGHAVALAILAPGSLDVVSLRQVAGAGGLTSAKPGLSTLLRQNDVTARLVVLMAGRAAEEELLGQPSSGAGGGIDSDLAQATELALAAATILGLDEVHGLTWWGTHGRRPTAGLLMADADLARRVHGRLADAYARARELLRPRTKAIATLAARLLQRRTLDGAEAEAIVADVERPRSTT